MMSEKSWQLQEQKLTQVQKQAQSISQQQMLVSSLVELPITQLADRINTEMNDNPALEVESPGRTPISQRVRITLITPSTRRNPMISLRQSAKNGSRPWMPL